MKSTVFSGHELDEIERVRALALERVQLFVGELHVLVLCDLVALDDVVALDVLVVDRAVQALLQPRAALLVQLIEVDALRRWLRCRA